MSLRTALTHRFAHWYEQLDMHGHLVNQTEDHINVQRGALEISATRAVEHGGPSVAIYISEIWVPGFDPCSLAPAPDGCHIDHSSWHAQIGGDDEAHAERIDIDRSKPRVLIRHRHPHGQPNAWREPTTINTPEAWMHHVEKLISTLYLPTGPGEKA